MSNETMKANGIRIFDKDKNIVCVHLPDILKEIDNGNQLNWSILYLYSQGNLGEGKPLPMFEEQILKSEKGLLIDWKELWVLAPKFYQIYDLVLIGSNDKACIRRYKNDLEMYATCDVVIVMFDCTYWEIFAKDDKFLNRLVLKFNEITFLESDSKELREVATKPVRNSNSAYRNYPYKHPSPHQHRYEKDAISGISKRGAAEPLSDF